MNTQQVAGSNFPKQPTLVTGLRRPTWICSNNKQAAILVRDASGSMSGQKVLDASAASQDLVGELALPTNKDGFEVGVVDFSDDAQIVHDLSKATALSGSVKPIALVGSTNITRGLELADQLLTQAEQSKERHLRPVVLLFTDGGHNVGAGPETIAAKVRTRADLVTVAFGSDADEDLLRRIATSPQHFYRCRNGKELRQFLAAVGATLCATMSRGQNATMALTQLRHQ